MAKQPRITIKPIDFTRSQWEELCAYAMDTLKLPTDIYHSCKDAEYKRTKGAVEQAITQLHRWAYEVKRDDPSDMSRRKKREWVEDLEGAASVLEGYLHAAKPALMIDYKPIRDGHEFADETGRKWRVRFEEVAEVEEGEDNAETK